MCDPKDIKIGDFVYLEKDQVTTWATNFERDCKTNRMIISDKTPNSITIKNLDTDIEITTHAIQLFCDEIHIVKPIYHNITVCKSRFELIDI